MAFTLIDYFNAFDKVSKEEGFLASARSLYYALLGEFNAAGFPKEIKISVSTLMEEAGIRSIKYYKTAISQLEESGFISVESTDHSTKTIYRLLERKEKR